MTDESQPNYNNLNHNLSFCSRARGELSHECVTERFIC